MPQKYEHLNILLQSDQDAHEYFMNLPVYVREFIAERGAEVNSFSSLRSHAENATKGDD